MRLRSLGCVLLLVLLVVGVAVPTPAGAGEPGDEEEEEDLEHEPLPSIEEVGTGSEIAEQFRPEPPEEQPFTDAMVWPLMAGAVLLFLAVVLLYVRWLPRFSQEREQERSG